MTTHYFPDADEPALQPFTQAFVGMMFAHAAFERRVSELMGIITGIVDFGERPENQWKADDRPKRMKRLIREHHLMVYLKRRPSWPTSSVRSHVAATATYLRMGVGGSSTLTQT
jgi:hypothetical protein